MSRASGSSFVGFAGIGRVGGGRGGDFVFLDIGDDRLIGLFGLLVDSASFGGLGTVLVGRGADILCVLVWEVVSWGFGGTGGGCSSLAGSMSWVEALSMGEPLEAMLERKAVRLEPFVGLVEEMGRGGRMAGPD